MKLNTFFIVLILTTTSTLESRTNMKILVMYKPICNVNEEKIIKNKFLYEKIDYLDNLNIAILYLTPHFLIHYNDLNKYSSLLKQSSDCIENATVNESSFAVDNYNKQNEKDSLVDFEKLKTWHLMRINQKSSLFSSKSTSSSTSPFFSLFERRISPVKNPNSLTSHVLVFDSGIDSRHLSLKNKLGKDYHISFIENEDCCEYTPNQSLCDCYMHGTHVAGLIASEESGYNPNTFIYSFKVLDKEGEINNDSLLKAISKAIEFKKEHNSEVVIANMSFALHKNNFIVEEAIKSLFKAGVFIVASAGNSSKDACYSLPGNSNYVMTVGSIDINDNLSEFSNYGQCVDMYAPGTDIYSTITDNMFDYESGTSMSAPIVSGFASAVGSFFQITDPRKLKKKLKTMMRRIENKDQVEKDVEETRSNENMIYNFMIYDGK